ncbi:uncharacterized protein TNCV_1335611 [Trichonephila clavipes]|nr:uncharacterized protein TNCV_1335611 [Trichonephila clavipes]
MERNLRMDNVHDIISDRKIILVCFIFSLLSRRSHVTENARHQPNGANSTDFNWTMVIEKSKYYVKAQLTPAKMHPRCTGCDKDSWEKKM